MTTPNKDTTAPKPIHPQLFMHSPLPWKFDDDSTGQYTYVADANGNDAFTFEGSLANGEYVLHACNHFPDLYARNLALSGQVQTLRAALADTIDFLERKDNQCPTQNNDFGQTADKARLALTATEHQSPPAVTVAARVLNAAWEVVREYNNDDRDLTPFIDKLTAALEATEKKGTQCAA